MTDPRSPVSSTQTGLLARKDQFMGRRVKVGGVIVGVITDLKLGRDLEEGIVTVMLGDKTLGIDTRQFGHLPQNRAGGTQFIFVRRDYIIVPPSYAVIMPK